MMVLHGPDFNSILSVVRAVGWFAVGVLIGALHFLTLRHNARMFASDRSLPKALALQILRLTITVTALAIIAIQFAALPLLITAAGILMARTIVVGVGDRP